MNDSRINDLARDLRLPAPAEHALEHSQQLTGLIREQIEKNGGNISFERYMEMALYEPGWGYYSAGASRFGPSGDFITAPHVSPLFSRCVARQCAQVLSSTSSGDILEIGAGSGVMAKDILLELDSVDALPNRYLILETSADLRMRQQELFTSHIPHLLPRIQWLDSLPVEPISGVIIANEVVDALPVKRVVLDKGLFHELCVGHDGDEFYWIETPPGDLLSASLEQIANNLQAPLPEPYATEVNLRVTAWIRSISETLQQGVMLLIDYGYPQHEYYHPQRDEGTLLCHYRHRSHDDPFLYPGLQDITASVDFTALARAALDNEMQVAGYTSQAHFLIGCGLAEIAPGFQTGEDFPDPAVSGQIKRLTLPGEMGERFKAIAFCRDYTENLIGFRFMDQQERLW